MCVLFNNADLIIVYSFCMNLSNIQFRSYQKVERCQKAKTNSWLDLWEDENLRDL